MNYSIDTPIAAMDFQQHYLTYKNLVDRRLDEVCTGRRPESLYEPTRYVLGGGGKRIRAVLVMLASEAVGGNGREALDAGAAVEIMHNFTLCPRRHHGPCGNTARARDRGLHPHGIRGSSWH